MSTKDIILGNGKLNSLREEPQGGFVEIGGEKYYRISHYQHMPDFFMTVVSNSDHWMFLSSNGSLSAGRKDSDNALFPYYTVDKIHDYRGLTGSRTWCLVEDGRGTSLWEPFTRSAEENYAISRNLYKSEYGNKVLFEEDNLDLGISFRYGWSNSERFGWVRSALIKNISGEEREVRILDGIRNILPYGADRAFQTEYSNLMDAYKKNELLPESHLGLFVLSSIPVDRAEPSEALKATTVWSAGLDGDIRYLLSDHQVEDFRRGTELETETDVRARRGAYYVNARLSLSAGKEREWLMVAELNQDAVAVAGLDQLIRQEDNAMDLLFADIKSGTEELVGLVAAADGLQMGNEELSCARHFSNTMFNIMRGGIFADQYRVDLDDFMGYLQGMNLELAKKYEALQDELPETISQEELLAHCRQSEDADLERIALEYLPLTFSRRHGDPSRPWNRFSIDIRNSDGSRKLNYQGNWRDIFQNWEALGYSYPLYMEGMLSRFLNASTADGYNPYRITREGLDWECPSPDDPWAYIGYWGDHQIIYLQKFLEQMEDYHPGRLEDLLDTEVFVYANVPYRIKDFDELLRTPKDTILFDHDLNREIEKRVESSGADGRLLQVDHGQPSRANLMEKLLVTLLAKMSNFIPEGGIWLNTQRPEWNDANNALVGSGVSMVTLYYIRRYLKFLKEILDASGQGSLKLAEGIAEHMKGSSAAFEKHRNCLVKGFSDEERYALTRALGLAGNTYRSAIYGGSGPGEKIPVEKAEILAFLNLALAYTDQSIRENQREDGLFHAYNLASFREGSIRIRHLYEMLEGQVAVLSAGLLSTEESLGVLDALKGSSMFREDQYSYMLYPDRRLPRFTEKNNLAASLVGKSEFLKKLKAMGDDSIIGTDASGNAHFNGSFRNANDLEKALDALDEALYGTWSQAEKQAILDIYEEVFDHQSFTGRSGTFYGYEGLGSIYWHMVSKLLLAVQECYFRAMDEQADAAHTDRLKAHYYEIKAGIGLYKSPGLYGAFPTDAYSHTPGGAGAKQPGLTGQVKEDVLSRMGELGVKIRAGSIVFDPHLLNRDEILKEEAVFRYVDRSGESKSLDLSEGQMGFTLCQVPVICSFGQRARMVIRLSDGEKQEMAGNTLPAVLSRKIFARKQEISIIEVYTP